MPDRATIIRDATLKARADWEAYVVFQNKQLYDLYQRYADELARELARSEYKGKIPPGAQARLNKVVKKSIPPFRKSIARSIQKGISRSVDAAFVAQIVSLDAAGMSQKLIQLGSSFIGKDGKIIRWNAAKETFLQSTWSRMNKTAVDAVTAWKPGGLAFSDRVWDLTYQSQKQMLRIIQSGVMEGKSAAKLSRELRGFLVQPETLRGKALKDLKPGRGVYKSAYKNAQRLASTEMNRAFVEGTYRYGQQKSWVDGYIWRRGGSGPCSSGVCSDNADMFFPKDDPPDIPAHPHCVMGGTKVNPCGELLAISRREYSGDMIEIVLEDGTQLVCTPNHPLITPEGPIPAALACIPLLTGPQLLYRVPCDNAVDIAVLWEQASSDCGLKVVHQTSTMFHGDGAEGHLSFLRPVEKGSLVYQTAANASVARQGEWERIKYARRWRGWLGHVYNLQTSESCYAADGVLGRNCRCYPETHIEGDPME